MAGNLTRIRDRIGPAKRILAVVKADAYGHGAIPVGMCLEQAGADCLAVALPEEGIELREAGVRCAILLLGPLDPDQFRTIFEYRLIPTLTEWPILDELEKAAARRGARLPFHLKVDTGMGRLGVLPESLPGGLERLRELKMCRLAGIFSHLACAEEASNPHTGWQRRRFEEALRTLKTGGIRVPMAHLANSAAILDHPDCLLQAVRPGILLYGCHPSESSSRMELEPVLQFRTRVLGLKEVPPGTPIGYGSTFRTRRPSRIAILPAGYHDGVPRSMPPRGSVLLRGKRAPLAGLVSMDLAVADVTEIPEVQRGDVATLVGRDGPEEIRIEEVAASARSIPYEILCRIGNRVPRVYHRTGIPVSIQGRLQIPAPDRPASGLEGENINTQDQGGRGSWAPS